MAAVCLLCPRPAWQYHWLHSHAALASAQCGLHLTIKVPIHANTDLPRANADRIQHPTTHALGPATQGGLTRSILLVCAHCKEPLLPKQNASLLPMQTADAASELRKCDNPTLPKVPVQCCSHVSMYGRQQTKVPPKHTPVVKPLSMCLLLQAAAHTHNTLSSHAVLPHRHNSTRQPSHLHAQTAAQPSHAQRTLLL